jgi:alkylation response protein AidB-like acyl-CoA dehydrogenase
MRRWLDDLVAVKPRLSDAMRNRLADHAIDIEIGRWLAYRVAWLGDSDRIANHEASMSKLFISDLIHRFSNTAVAALGMAAASGVALRNRASQWYLMTSSHTLVGGTNEIQKNIVAQRGLGLPRGE